MVGNITITSEELRDYYEEHFFYEDLTDEEYCKITNTVMKDINSDGRLQYIIEEAIQNAIDDYITDNNVKMRGAKL